MADLYSHVEGHASHKALKHDVFDILHTELIQY